MLAPSYYYRSANSQVNNITPCYSCDICKYHLVAEMKLTSEVTGKKYFTKRYLSYNSKNVICLITCNKRKDECTDLTVDFKPGYK